MSNVTFQELSLSPEMERAITDMGFVTASPIQAQTIPLLLEGHDVIGQAQTGTGKTAAFGIPLLEKLDPNHKHVSALVVCPTRELAVQVAGELQKLAKYMRGVQILPVFGGESIMKQIGAMRRGVQVVVGTPGRIIDHLERGTVSFDNVRMVIMDEADEMLNMGFREDMERILRDTPKERQTILFSATMPKPILELTRLYQRSPQHIKVTKSELTAVNIEQVYFEIRHTAKVQLMTSLIRLHHLGLSLAFCNTKAKVDEVVSDLKAAGLRADSIHGDLKQSQRTTVLNAFRKRSIDVLVATDVAARGIDVNDVDAVFNFDLPMDPESYVHRIGRTGRAGKSGLAISFVTGRNDTSKLRQVENYAKINIERQPLPTPADLLEMEKAHLLSGLEKVGNTEMYQKLAEELCEGRFSPLELAAALLKQKLGTQAEPLEGLGKSSGKRKDDRSPREDRGERRGEKRGNRQESDSGMASLYLDIGRVNKVSPGDILGAIAGETGLPGNIIGNIEIRDKFSLVQVPAEELRNIIKNVNNKKIKGFKVYAREDRAR